MKLKSIALFILLLTSLWGSAHDFSVVIKGQRLYFEISNKKQKTVSVTYGESIVGNVKQAIEGVVEIPDKVTNDGVTYTVTAIGPKAFANATDLSGIIIPAGVTSIGDFAFENCKSLNKVVFPGRQPKFGQGTFYNCQSISNVTLGSDWESVNLEMFRWSKELTEINIPAKITKIQGIKKLKYLTGITVDPNSAFAADGGLLYNNNFTNLIACPRAIKGAIKINDATKTIATDALIDCVEVTSIDFPASLKRASFRETSRMAKLERIIMRGEPFITGFIDGMGKFFFQLANPSVEIVVLNEHKSEFEQMLPTEAGEYRETTNGVPYIVTAEELPSKKNLKGVKNFDKY